MTRNRNSRPLPSGEPRLSLREPIDVLAAIPYLVGYHPTESVILLGMRSRRLVFTARYDLPSAGVVARDIQQVTDHMLGVLSRQNLSGVLVVGYGPDDRVRPVVLGVGEACCQAGLAVLEILRADDERYWSYLCGDERCCPPDGSHYDPSASAVAAEWTVAGRVALPDRESYEKQLAPVIGTDRVRMRQATTRADDRIVELVTRALDEPAAESALVAAGTAAIAAAVQAHQAGKPVGDDDTAWLTVLLSSTQVRDIAWAMINGNDRDLDLHRALWMDVLRRSEPDLMAAPGCLFAYAAWRCGEGALARIAIERVLAEDPNDSMALLLHNALANGLPPTALNSFPYPALRRSPARRPRKRSSSRRAGSRRG